MSDLSQYIMKRTTTDGTFADHFDEGYTNFKIGVQLRQAREAAGLSMAEVAQRLQTKQSTIVQIEDHADEVRLSLLAQYAKVLGKQLAISLV